MLENEVKSGKRNTICSVTGRSCRCVTSSGCSTAKGDGTLDPLPDTALRWAKASLLKLSAAEFDLDLALSACPRSRQAPELSEAQRLIKCARRMIQERL